MLNPTPSHNQIVTEIDNTLTARPADPRSDYLYGKRISKPVKILTEIIIQALRQLGVEFSIKSRHQPSQIRSTA
jgi:hypothetical protein